MKMLAIVGSGGKALKFYVFGSEYNFPGNCYSEDLIGNPGLLQSMAKGNGMIGAALAGGVEQLREWSRKCNRWQRATV